MTTFFLILLAVIIITGVYLNNLTSRIGIPALLAFMLLGILFANNGIWDIRFDNYDMAKETCTVALIFIMFYGGFGTRWDAVKPVLRESVLLASLGVVITAALVGVFCHLVLHWSWLEGLLFGSVMGSTDAASVFSILRGKRLGLRNNTAPMLEMESGSNDPASYMLTVIVLSIMNGTASGGKIAWDIFAQLFFGGLFGWGIAKLAALAMQRMKFRTAGYSSLFLLAIAIASYALPTLVGGNGYLSAYLVGIMLGNEEFRGKKELVNFFDALTGLMQMLIFFLIGLLARPAQMHKAVLPAVAIFLVLLLIARPAAVFSILSPFRKYPVKQQLLVSFVGLRGAASIVFAIMAMVDPALIENDIYNIVFLVVLLSISVQGSLIPFVAKKLDMVDPNANVLKTFNDYSEDPDVNFGKISITEGSPWAGKSIKDLDLPHNLLIALVVRGAERLRPSGSTVLESGDEVIVITRGFDDKTTYLEEEKVRSESRKVGKRLAECKVDGLIVLIRRGSENLIPNGDTVIEAGDRLVKLSLNN